MKFDRFALLFSLLTTVETTSQSTHGLRSRRKGEIRDVGTYTTTNLGDLTDAKRELENLFVKSSMSLTPSPHSLAPPYPSPTPKPTKKPTPKPTKKPTPKPTKKPTPKPTKKPVPKPSKHPSYKPSPSPKDCCGLPQGVREKQLFDIYKTVSNPDDILTPGTPQNQAFKYILEDEKYCLCPSNTSCELVQRYVMAVYYFSTGGDSWVNCGAKSSVCNPLGTTNPTSGETTSGCFAGSDARWLDPVSSCKWCGNICENVNKTCITKIDLGKTVNYFLPLLCSFLSILELFLIYHFHSFHQWNRGHQSEWHSSI
jgi:hypothetical protein